MRHCIGLCQLISKAGRCLSARLQWKWRKGMTHLVKRCENFPENTSVLNYVFFGERIKKRKGGRYLKIDRGHFTDFFFIPYDSFSAGCISHTGRLFYGEQKFCSHFTEAGTSLKLFLHHRYDLGSKAVLIGTPLANHWHKEARASTEGYALAAAMTLPCQQQANASELDFGLLFILDLISGFQVSGGLCSDS